MTLDVILLIEEDVTYIVDEVTDSLVYVASDEYFCRVLAQKQYEMSNHLGNVLATVLDRRTGVFDEGADTLMYYEADVVNATLYYPFGMNMMGYSNVEFAYSFGMNTQEKDDEIYGDGNSYSAEFWQYDVRFGRRWNRDVVYKIDLSDYVAFSNNLIVMIDPSGDDDYYNEKGEYLYTDTKTTSDIRVIPQAKWDEIHNNYSKQLGETDKSNIELINTLNSSSQVTSFERLSTIQFNNGKHMEFLNSVVREYKLENISKNYTFLIDNTIGMGILITDGKVGEHQIIKMSTATIVNIGKNDIDVFAIAMAHEFIHVYQKSEQKMTDHNEREFLAYHFSLFPNQSVLQERAKKDPNFDIAVFNEASIEQKKAWVIKGLNYYAKLSPEMQKEHKQYYDDMTKLKSDLGI